MNNIILYLWQLPQNILGLILVHCYKIESVHEYGDGKHIVKVYGSRNFHGGISLGKYIIVRCGKDGTVTPTTRAHEYGHSIQSLRFGWLYLFVVGIVSGIRCGLHLYKNGCYYDAFPEKQADRLGGVRRDKNGRRYVQG